MVSSVKLLGSLPSIIYHLCESFGCRRHPCKSSKLPFFPGFQPLLCFFFGWEKLTFFSTNRGDIKSPFIWWHSNKTWHKNGTSPCLIRNISFNWSTLVAMFVLPAVSSPWLHFGCQKRSYTPQATDPLDSVTDATPNVTDSTSSLNWMGWEWVGRWWFHFFKFSTLLEEMIPIETYIFQLKPPTRKWLGMGWIHLGQIISRHWSDHSKW